jgi:PIN domain nuclease of toxin-antitoxin system
VSVLFDTNVILPILEDGTESLPRGIQAMIAAGDVRAYASVASLWEIAIKNRLGKLPLRMALFEIPSALDRVGFTLLVIDHRHALAELETDIATRDLFDRLLLAQCQIEGLRLVTVDRALESHPLAWRAP